MKPSVASIALLVLFSAFVAPVRAQKAHWGSPDDPVVKMIKVSEKMWLDSGCSPQPGLKDVIADDFQGTAPSGKRYGKGRAIGSAPKRPAHDCKLGDVTVHFFGDAIALVYGSESNVRKDKHGIAHERCLVWTDTWLKRSGKWQIVAAQDNHVTCK